MTKKSLLSFVLLLFCFQAHALKVGEAAPGFELRNANGKVVKLSDYKGKRIVLEWFNHECPYVVKHYSSGNMQELQKKYIAEDVIWLTVLSSAPGQQGYLQGGELNRVMKDRKSNATEYLVDANGKVGKLYDAKTTPHMYVIDESGKLVYAGAIDDKPTTNLEDVKGATNYVAQALDAIKNKQPVKTAVTRAYGCSVKY